MFKLNFIPLLLIGLLSCHAQKKEACFVVDNQNEDDLSNLYIQVKNGFDSLKTSPEIIVKGNTKEAIYFPLEPTKMHYEYEIFYTRNNEKESFDFGNWSQTVPFDESFMIRFELDTVDIRAFYVK